MHTKGKWEHSSGGIWAISPWGARVKIALITLFSSMNGIDSKANGDFIAAAPDLYEALVMVRDADEDCKRDGLPTIPTIARGAIDDAIAKAEGRS